MLRRLMWLIILLAAAVALAWALWPKPVTVETAEIGRHDIVVAVEEDGISRIREVFVVSAPISGQMQRVDLHAGDRVTGGETVVAAIRPAAPSLLDARARGVAEATEAAAKAAVDLAAAEVRQAEAQLRFLQSELVRATSLVLKGTISERAFEKANLDVESAAATLASAKAAHMVRQRELDSARAALVEGGANGTPVKVRAPVSGRVLRVLTESEQVVQAATPLVEIGDPANLEIVSDLLSRDAVRIAVGAEAEILNWGGPPLSAQVSRIDPLAVTKVSALGIEEQRVPVVLQLEGQPDQWSKLGHDFRVVVRIGVWKGENRLAVPLGALFRRGADWAVFVADSSRARLRILRIGQRNTEVAEVLDGLAEGEVVILHPSDRVTDGIRIEPDSAD